MGVVLYTLVTATWEMEAGGLLEPRISGQRSETQSRENKTNKTKIWSTKVSKSTEALTGMVPNTEHPSCFRFHAFAERTECLEFSAFSTEDVDGAVTWNSRKLKGRLPPGTWTPEGAAALITLIISSGLPRSLEVKAK